MRNSTLLFTAILAINLAGDFKPLLGAETSLAAKAGQPAKESVKLPVRLAILNAANSGTIQETNAVTERLTDLIAARLSTAACFQLVERSELNRVLGEISLTLMSDANAVKKAGTLLTADWFLIGSLPVERTNVVIAKLVEARTGIIRDLVSFTFEKKNPIAVAESIAGFAINATTNSLALGSRQYLGVGGFADISVNDKYPEFTKQMRQSLERAYVGSRVTIVERGMIHPLFRELRMNIGGLTGSTNEVSAAQPAMFLIDGYFQSFQDTEAKVSLALRVQKIGQREQLFSFTLPMGTQLVAEISSTLNGLLLNDKPRAVPVSALEEANLQLSRGKERSELPRRIDSHYLMGAGANFQNHTQRRRNILEAIEAFEATLFLDPQREEAKLYLGACLVNPLIRRTDEGKDLLSEIIRGSTNQQSIAAAKSCLENVFPPPEPDPLPRPEQLRKEEEKWLQSCAAAAIASREGKWFPAHGLTYNSYSMFHSLLDNDIATTRKYLDGLVVRIETAFPELTPYFAGSYARWCSDFSSPNPEQVEKFRKALDWCEQNPEFVARYWFYRDVLFRDIDWCLRRNHIDLAEKAVNLIEKSAGPKLNVNDRPELDLRRGAVLRGREKWAEALKLYQSLQSRYPLDLTKEMAECRTNLSPVQAVAPATIVLGSPVRTFAEGAALKYDGKYLWAGDGAHLRRYFNGAWTDISLPETFQHMITSIAATPHGIACGTDGGGVFLHDERNNRWRQFTEQDGLLQPTVRALYAAGNRLWIGFGDGGKDTGGLGYLDLETFKFVGITPTLEVAGGRLVTDKQDQPPKGWVVGLFDDGNFLWAGVKGKGLQRYDHRAKVWETATTWRGFDKTQDRAIADSRNSVAAIALNPFYIAVVCDKTRGWGTGGTYWGGLSFYSVEKKEWTIIAEPQGLPINWFYSVAIDGDRLWAGGRGVLAHIDMRSGRISGLWQNADAHVWSIEVGADAVWISINEQLFRQPRLKM